VEDIATDGDISPNTIRTHVRGVLEKTGCNRQVEIVALLTAISSTRLTSPISRGARHPRRLARSALMNQCAASPRLRSGDV
jgi:hypothetical protein